MKILAIDPGNMDSAFCWLIDGQLKDAKKCANSLLLALVPQSGAEVVVIEMIAGYGMRVGQSIFETCVFVGRLIQTCLMFDVPYHLVFRKNVVTHLCGNATAGDAFVREALIDRYGIPGTKKTPGPTYGIANDMWAALAVATYYHDAIEGK